MHLILLRSLNPGVVTTSSLNVQLRFFIAQIEIANSTFSVSRVTTSHSAGQTIQSFANWRHKEVQLLTKRALFFLLHLFLRPTEIRPKVPEMVTNRFSHVDISHGKKSYHNNSRKTTSVSDIFTHFKLKSSVAENVAPFVLFEPAKFHFAACRE